MNATKLTSTQNETVKAAVKLRDRKGRDATGLTLLEGYRELTRAIEYGRKLEDCFFCPGQFLGVNEHELLENLARHGVRLYEVPDFILTKLAYRDRPEGLIATMRMTSHRLDDLPETENAFYLVAEAVEKPGNLGSILRSADAAGADALIVCDKRTDIYNPNVIRASTGALFAVPLALTETDELIPWLRKRNIQIVATSPHATPLYTDVDLTGNIAIAVGTEQVGLSDQWLAEADISVQIPMLGKIDSLNVATATTILLYEAARQRRWKCGTAKEKK
ncbi:MAG: TrmH family RNA methyltransferase [Victivallaceae bacterium]|nr:RNA methyltransferase [Victivallaceae bacterium]